MEKLTQERERSAERYLNEIHNDAIILPMPRTGPGDRTVWHQFVIRCKKRKALIDHLMTRGIGTLIHYPIPPHLSEAYSYLGHCKGFLPITEDYADTVCSIPIFNGMTETEQSKVIDAINIFEK